MKKIKLQIPTGEWDDISSKYSPDDNRFVGQNAFTSGTKNIDTEQDGTIRKMKGGVQFATTDTSPKDQHEAIFSDGTRHLLEVDDGDLRFTAGEPTFTDVTTGYSAAGNFEFATYQDRVYFGNGINPNQVYDKTTSYGGVGYSAPQTKDLGAQVPSTAPTAALGAAGSSVPAGGHTYKVTFLYYDSEESNGSPASNLVTVTGSNEQVDLTSIPVGGYGVTARKVYRDNNDGVYVLVGTISDNTTTIFSDTVAGGTTPIPVDNGVPPTFSLIRLFNDRLWFGGITGEPFTLYFSEVGLPDITESTNFIDCNPEDPITALTVYRGRLVVFNRRSMGQILGDTKDSFNYDPIQGSVGCVDTRSVQEIVLNGVPVLVWLSDKGFYGFNGSSVNYLSESIEDLVNANIQQALVQKNQQVDTTDADFNAGTLSDGIEVAGGQISTRGYLDGTSTPGNNPRRTWNDTGDWDGGDSLDNIATINEDNELRAVTDFSINPGEEGTKDNLIPDSTTGIKIDVVDDNTGDSNFDLGTRNAFTAPDGPSGESAYAQPITIERGGTLTEIKVLFDEGNTIVGVPIRDRSYRLKVWRDSLGQPGTVAYTSDLFVASHGSLTTVSRTISVSVSSGETIWFGAEIDGVETNANDPTPVGRTPALVAAETFVDPGKVKHLGVWVTTLASAFLNGSYLYSQDAVPASGQWISTVFDSESLSANTKFITHTSTIPAGTSVVTRIDAGDELDFSGNIISEIDFTTNDLSGSVDPGLEDKRYWKVTITLNTDDDRITPIVDGPVLLEFEDTGEWISEAIDTTSDSTIYNTLDTISTTPGSSTVVTEIRTADTEGGLTAAPWVTFGSHTVRKWAQVRLTLTKDGATTPAVSSVNFTWTIVANLISEAINTTIDPAGWDIFQSDFTLNGGTILFEQKSATTEGGLSGATYFTVTNGNFPPSGLPTDQYTQWRSTLTATDGNVPLVSSVTIGWLIGVVDSVRAASIFHDKNYYIALAELGESNNNLIIQLDGKGKWRIKRGLGISTLGFFFNDPYFGSSTSGVVGRFLQGFKDLGTDIEIDIRTRAFDYSNTFFDNSEFDKVPESIIIEGRGTGATYDVSYSLDNGETFTNFIDAVTGGSTFTTTNDDKLFQRVFRVDAETDGFIGTKTIMYRIHTNDEFDIKLHRVKGTAFLTTKEPIITG